MPRYPGGIIRKTPVTPTGPFQDGTAPGMWTLAEASYWTKQGLWPIAGNAYTDPNFENVTLLLPGNGTNGAQNNTFLDSSTNNFTVTRNGETTQGSFSPYSDLWSNYFDGTGDYLSIPDNAALELSSSNFTIEAWVYLIAGGTNQTVIQKRSSGAVYGGYALYITSGNNLGFIATSSGSNWEVLINGGTVPTNQWTHVAATRSGSTWKIWLNGAEVGTTTSSITVSDNTDSVGVGAIVNGDQPINGYISNLRIVKGTAVYTSNFTPPTAPLTAISGTSLLTCQSNRFRDASSNNFAITVAGNTSVTNFAPFNPTAAYDPATNGGSGYFDGSGDYLTASTSYTLSGDFTVECWVYATGNANQGVIQLGGNLSGTSYPISIAMYPNGEFQWGYQTSYTSTTGGKFPIKTWIHIALVRNAGVTRLYLNGVDTGSTLNVSTSYSISSVFIGTYYSSSYPFNGYISNVRVVNGTAVYTSNFTPPTAPVTAITNTSLLLNFTNAGIVDASAKNDLFTLGNAQISTAQSVFGGGSMAFDGAEDAVIALHNLGFTFGSSNFTVELWFNANAVSSQQGLVGQGNLSSPSSISFFLDIATTTPRFFVISGTTEYNINSSTGVVAGTWYHLAGVRDGNTLRLFLNGTQVGTRDVTGVTVNNVNTVLGVGRVGTTSGKDFNGYIDDLRITKGVARYTANFTPPTRAFPVQ